MKTLSKLSSITIIHQNRHQLGITCEEYCMVEFINEMIGDKNQRVFIYTDTVFKAIAKYMKFSLKLQQKLMKSLIKKGFYRADKRVITRLSKSIIAFYPNSNEAELIWVMGNKTGNKQRFEKAYALARKEYSFDFLENRLKMYLIHIAITGHSQQHLATFFGIKNKEFLNEFQTKIPDNKVPILVKPDFFE